MNFLINCKSNNYNWGVFKMPTIKIKIRPEDLVLSKAVGEKAQQMIAAQKEAARKRARRWIS